MTSVIFTIHRLPPYPLCNMSTTATTVRTTTSSWPLSSNDGLHQSLTKTKKTEEFRYRSILDPFHIQLMGSLHSKSGVQVTSALDTAFSWAAVSFVMSSWNPGSMAENFPPRGARPRAFANVLLRWCFDACKGVTSKNQNNAFVFGF